ncbi:hypothetical protein L207DRAFT_414448 [Hyaloscypha variabilis F]|uniref:Uncharacterized protein n=1 Tax=Hyaloscypha variabilis (strain UAMH 11265 / GT02V1 / F) TaxID=1149755 RepID=A0A2J6SCU3_HYAVF|nr:hypothetical protein L207DRAFT_414448 [Hyaloscypha variabilis F]
MHVQTQTATMAYHSLPALPASPTLTNPDMILPYGEYDSTPSPPQHPYRPPSPGDDWGGSRSGDMQFSLGLPHAMVPLTPTTPIIYGNGTMLSDIGEVTEAESTPGRKLPGPAERRLRKQALNTPLRSSPTIGYDAMLKRVKSGTHERKVSMESTSTITSEGQAAELFKDFDDGVSVDDSVCQGDDEESVADSYSEEVIASETQRLAMKEAFVGREEDRNSSAALSRRAEQILLNAKKRLNNMEGNLTRARSSLYIIPSGSMSSIHSSSPLSRSTPSPPQNDMRIIPPLGVSPAKHRQLHTPADSPKGSPGHSRVYSENSISATLRTAPFPVRSASAAAQYMSKGDGSQLSPPMPSPDAAREDFRASSRGGYTTALSKSSPPHGVPLEPLSEDEVVPEFEVDRASERSSLDGYLSPNGEHRILTRSTSSMQMRDLRDQMQDLKGRLSVLRDRARDDTMKRRSLQSLRTPSPFTAAEQWYTTSKNYGEPLSADAGVAHPPWKDESSEDVQAKHELGVEGITKEAPEYASSDVTSVYEDVVESHHATDGLNGIHEATIEEEGEGYDTALEEGEGDAIEDDIGNDYNDEMVDREEADDYESDASLYHDSLATPISHEDREDAFDYEHFFLHSAMGTISQQRLGRRDSVGSFSSEDSVETTRGPSVPIAVQQGEQTESDRMALGHFRSESTDSVSTMATFATAKEGRGSDSGDEEERDTFAVQQGDVQPRSITPVTAKRSTFGTPVKNGTDDDEPSPPQQRRRSASAITDQEQRNSTTVHRPSVASFDSFESVGTVRSFPLVNKPKSQQSLDKTSNQDPREAGSLLSDSVTLTEAAGDRLQPSPVHMLAKEDQILVERLVASLGKCVLGLQEAGRASYEGRVWRRRLDAARRVLEGQEGAV